MGLRNLLPFSPSLSAAGKLLNRGQLTFLQHVLEAPRQLTETASWLKKFFSNQRSLSDVGDFHALWW